MKTSEPLAKLLLLFLFTGCSNCGWSQSTIAYSAGPAFQIPTPFVPASIDLDRDGSPDFSFIGGLPLCTMDVPTSLCTWSFYVATLGTNGLLVQGSDASLLSAGEWIAPMASSNGVWSSAGNATLLSFFWSQRLGTSGSTGPLATLGEGYLGARFYGADGLHYGWVHVRLELAPVVIDWAYETRPGVPIQAGAKPVPVPLASPEVARPGYLRLRWPSEIGKAYQVQVKGRLETFAWTNLSFAIPASTTNTMVDLPMSEAAQFFRVVQAD